MFNNKFTHRDLKPQNILIKNREIKIGDFGFAKEASYCFTNLGTPAYMAPEILLNK